MRARRCRPTLLLVVSLVSATVAAAAAAPTASAGSPSPSASPTATVSPSGTASPAPSPPPSSRPAPPPPTPRPSKAARSAPPAASSSPTASASPSASPSASVDAAKLERERRAMQEQARLFAAAIAYQHSFTEVTQARLAATQADIDARIAAQAARSARQVLAEHAAHLYRQGAPDSMVIWLTGDPSDISGMARAAVYSDEVGAANQERLEQARQAVDDAQEARVEARRAQRRADAAAADAEAALADLQARAELITAEFNVAIMAAARERAELAAQAQRANAAAIREWETYLAALAGARIVPPPAAALDDPAHLPKGMQPLRDKQGRPIPGVAATKGAVGAVTVLPAETVQAVSTAVRALGTPYLPDATGPEFYDCGRLTAAVWAPAGPRLSPVPAAQQAAVRSVPADSAQIGDLVFVGDRSGTHHVGLHLGNGRLLSAAASSGQVEVGPIPDGVVSFGRVTLGPPERADATRPAAGMRCGAPDLATDRNGAWGGYPNGMIPPAALCPLPSHPGQLLRCDAARALQALAASYLRTWHTPLCVTDSYRSIAGQIALFALKPDLAALPGRSEHGWGLALDLCGGVEQFGTPQHEWLRTNAARFGWVHPAWARAGGAKPEPWHWEFAGRAVR